MSCGRVLRCGLSLSALAMLLCAEPAAARRTVIDEGATVTLSGYCSPGSANTPDCAPYSLSSPLQIGGTSYGSFYVNSNGTVSLGSIESFLAPQNSLDNPPAPQTSLTEYGSVPVFSPNFSDGQGFSDPFNPDAGFDGNFVAQTSLNPDGFSVSFFSCLNPLACGQVGIDLVANATFDQNEVGNFGLVDTIIASSTLVGTHTDEENFLSGQQNLLAQLALTLPIYTITLATLSDGFEVGYSYNPAATGTIGTYGFNLPTGSFETTGALHNQTFLFDSVGQLVTGVPEPSTWMSMLLGFGLLGFALRRDRRARALPA